MKHYLATLFAVFSVVTTASAHTAGHATESAQTVQHIFTSSDHLLMLGSILVVAGAFGYKRLQARKI
jgi:hypothetical protein